SHAEPHILIVIKGPGAKSAEETPRCNRSAGGHANRWRSPTRPSRQQGPPPRAPVLAPRGHQCGLTICAAARSATAGGVSGPRRGATAAEAAAWSYLTGINCHTGGSIIVTWQGEPEPAQPVRSLARTHSSMAVRHGKTGALGVRRSLNGRWRERQGYDQP